MLSVEYICRTAHCSTILLKKISNAFIREGGFVYFAASSLINSVAGGLFYLYFASIVSVEIYGQANYFISSASIGFAVSALGMDTAIMTFLPKRTSEFLHQANFLVFVASSIATLALAILTHNLVISILTLGIAFYYMSQIQLIARKKYKENMTVTVGGKILQIFLSISLYFILGIDGFILGYAIAYLAFSYRFIHSLTKFNFKFNELKSTWRTIAQMYGANTANTLLSYLDKIIVGFIFGYYILGSYQLSFQVYTLLSVIPSTLFRYLLPHESGGIVKRKIKIIGIVMSGGVSLSIFIVAPYAIQEFYPHYSHATAAIQIISLALVPLTLVNLLGAKIWAEEKRTKHVFFVGIVTILTEISLLIILGNLFGINGLATAVVITSCVQFFYLLKINKGQLL